MIRLLLDTLRTLMSVPHDNPNLLRAQYVALSRQLPLMYLVLLLNMWALAVTHLATAPFWLSFVIPLIMTLACVLRARMWLRCSGRLPADAQILASLRRTNHLVPIVAGAFTAWSLALYPYGDAYSQSQIAFFMGITVIVCIFCMMHLRPAALTTSLVVNLAFVIFFASTHNPAFIATAVNILLVSLAMLIILQHHYRDFTRLVNVQAQTEQLSNENLRLANQDSLTGLPNRRQFFTTLESAMSQAIAKDKRLAVGILDLDGFKPVNDLYGHSVGDKILIMVGRRLLQLAGATLHVARLGGDEFALVLEGDLSDEDLQAFGKAVCEQLHVEFLLVDVPIQIGATLGIATFPHGAASAIELFEYADYALYQGKRHNPGSMCLFSASHREQLQRDAVTEQALRRAVLDKEFFVLFQPILDCRSRETIAFEALARWNSPELGQVSPAQFIPIAERIGLINRLTLPLLRQALGMARMWPHGMRLSFNLSVHDCGSRDSVQSIIDVINASGFNPAHLDLEITETAIMQDIPQVQWAIGQFRKLGCGISLDDFGTGYSSLSQLHALALTKLKIDRSFVTELHTKPASYKIVKSLVALSLDMELECVVEGVETQEELNALRSLGCMQVQGFFFCRPVAFADTLVWLAQAEARRGEWVALQARGSA
ncbi:EAL domain-containing protein [Pseudomonas gingeri]|uniref:putative bifunctional diguanylate cyclase/phosphodiesterase n=1 Tax=Pseudomonas gingeri TaxID=117681 RepID=UPI0015A16745|nr:EAL domain-containing protein [Pseudomonas gingeri]NWA29203.1 EAL domain-containing protein [Pseudomonas gingeri]NWD67992.1 EAL domain-containing protein [Pseudomonas gingeri]NWD73159.1 EAL domain-containing protein [Pseudomonas gingeri]